MKRIWLAGMAFALICTAAASAREVLPFNDGWHFLKGPFDAKDATGPKAPAGDWEEVAVPHTWNATDMQLEQKKYYAGDTCYRKTFTVPKESKAGRTFIRFEGVGSVADLYLNGKFIGTHKGAYSAFVFDLTNALHYDKPNELLLRVSNKARPDVIPVNHYLFGVYGGIYRPVWLIRTESVNIAVTDYASPGVYLNQKRVTREKAEVNVLVKLENRETRTRDVTVHVDVLDHQGTRCAEAALPITLLPGGRQRATLDFSMENPRLWNGRKDPYLYQAVVTVKAGGREIDRVTQPLGLRFFEIIPGDGFYLNGEKTPMYGVCRHQDWWGLGSALTDDHHNHDLDVIMDLGATTVRFAHYQQAETIYAGCDKRGLLVWAEIPFVNRVTGQEGPNAREQLRELIRQNYNHPSIYIWGLHNEVYSPIDFTAALTTSLHDLAKEEDPYRYTGAVNGHGTMEHGVNLQADVQGMNRYYGWYEGKLQGMVPWIENLETKYPDVKFMLTEYGADANIDHQTEILGDSLNWTKPFYPETFQTKTHEYHWAVIKDHPYIIASYLWNTFDFGFPDVYRGDVPARNMKGLVTIDRKTYKDSYFFYKASWSKEPVLYITQRRLKNRERQNTTITVYSNRGVPSVSLNGKPLPPPRKGYTDIHYIFDSVTLQTGENIISASVKDGDASLTDTATWIWKGEEASVKAEGLGSEKEHAGFEKGGI